MAGRIEPVAGEIGEIDAADERAIVVDDDELLVMAVHRALASVRRDEDARVTCEARQLGMDVASARVEERERRTRPGEHVHLDPLAELAQQLVEREARWLALEREVGREEPAGEQDAPTCAPQLAHHGRERVGPIDEDLELVALPGGLGRLGPVGRADVERVLPADAAQATAVVRADRALELLADEAVDAIGHVGELRDGDHEPFFPGSALFTPHRRER